MAQEARPGPAAADAQPAGAGAPQPAAARPQRAHLPGWAADAELDPAPRRRVPALPGAAPTLRRAVVAAAPAGAAAPDEPLLGPALPSTRSAADRRGADVAAATPAAAAMPAAPATPAAVAAAAAALATLPLGHLVSRHRRPRRELLRRLRGHHADDQLALDALGRAGGWARTLRSATACGWVELAAARAALDAPPAAAAAARFPAPCATAAGLVIAGSGGHADGDGQALIAQLEAERARIRPQRGSRLPWLHLVGTYGRPCGHQQMLLDSLAVMRGGGLGPAERPWALFGHHDHWHLIAGRVGADGRSWQKAHNLALRLTVDVLDAESGWRTGYDAPGGPDRYSAWAYHRLAAGTLANQLLGVGAQGLPTAEEVPVQGPAWAARLAMVGPHEERISGLLVLSKPSYATLDYIVPHCIDGG
jgi:hypothetical protein